MSKLLSLFDGSGGFPLAAIMSGIEPVAASEIEPFPLRVTTRRFPNMKHLGDVSQINGAEIEPVDIITFGSPCQDLSIAGKRKGLNHSDLGDEETTRSGLFMEAIRIIREMKEATDGKYPTFAVWENVPGAYSSNKGEDFRIVLEEFEKAASGAEIYVPKPPKGRWLTAGEIVGDHYSIAWRTFDAQYWGVPQRRKRIYLVADFRGQRAGKILFESEGVSGYTPQGFRSWQGAAGASEKGSGTAGCVVLNDQGGNRMDVTDGVTCTLRAEAHHPPCVMESAGFCTEPSAHSRSIGYEEETSPTLRAGTVPAAVYENHSDEGQQWKASDVANTITGTDYKGTQLIGIPRKPKYIVRRLTPLECCRLQGFPDWWCDGLETEEPTEEDLKFWREVFETHRKIVTGSIKSKSDKQIIKWLKDPYSNSAIYKMWGNGIALPNALFVMLGIARELQR